MKTALVLGAGGFIGSHLMRRLKSEGYWVRGVDLKYPEFSEVAPRSADGDFIIHDLRIPRPELFECWKGDKVMPFDEVYQLAADMGGAGFVFTGENDADIMHNSALINLNVLDALDNLETWANHLGFTGKVFYSSSACMYPQEIQSDVYNPGLKEEDAYPSNPDSEYGWEKLFSERLYLAYARNKDIDVRIARFHNIYGPEGTYKGGREKAPAAMCRKVIECVDNSGITLTRPEYFIEVWGTGNQTRSFLYIDDCIDAVRLLMNSDFSGPVNIGSEEMVTVNMLADMAIGLSGKSIQIKNIPGPVGVQGRNSDNTLIEEKLGWKPKYSLREGMEKTYQWIQNEMDRA